MEKSKIILEAECELVDNPAREMLKILETRIQTINERTKNQTHEIRNLKQQIKILKEK